ncbi:MAG: hypothetical protein WA057_03645 [Candidatus Magasanikiibacteriota bacterium]
MLRTYPEGCYDLPPNLIAIVCLYLRLDADEECCKESVDQIADQLLQKIEGNEDLVEWLENYAQHIHGSILRGEKTGRSVNAYQVFAAMMGSYNLKSDGEETVWEWHEFSDALTNILERVHTAAKVLARIYQEFKI